VGDLQIRAMTQEEFASYRRRAISHYAAELVRAGASTEEKAEQQATKETDASLPDGADTREMALLVGQTAGEVVDAAEHEAQRRGGRSIGLNVFGGNDVALGMYESSGYEVAAIQMQKRFASSSGPG
jgi:hypothetical protein